MLVLGVDPGTAITGYGAVKMDGDRPVLVDCGTIRTDADDLMPARLLSIHRQLQVLIASLGPDLMAVEELFFNRNVKSALAVGQARGVLIVTAAAAGVPVRSYTPPQVKAAVTGYGAADKHQVRSMVGRILHLDSPPRPDDVTDALAVAICCLHSRTWDQPGVMDR